MEQKFENVAPELRLQLLKDNCLRPETESVKIDFTEDDLASMKDQLSENSIIQSELEDELKEVSKGLRERIKEKKVLNKSLLKDLKNKFYLETQEVYLFDDQDAGLMLTYNSLGELIYSRKLKASEKQTNIRTLNTGTHGN